MPDSIGAFARQSLVICFRALVVGVSANFENLFRKMLYCIGNAIKQAACVDVNIASSGVKGYLFKDELLGWQTPQFIDRVFTV